MEPEPVELTFLGSGDAFGSGGRFQACVHVRAGPTRFVIDCGASSLVAMKRFGADPSAVETVLLSHLHGDHFGGLPFLVLDGQFARRAGTLRVAGPPGVEARVRDAMEVLFPGSSRVARAFALDFLELPERRETRLGCLTVTAYPVVHPSGAPAFALRVAVAGRVIGYSGDTEWTESLVEAARGADVFVCEAYFFEKRVKYHLDWRTVREHRDRLECRRLILTHMSEDLLRRLPLDGVECAEDGLTVTL
jgi:ribonuclease BN (tRNA processing enzyme)